MYRRAHRPLTALVRGPKLACALTSIFLSLLAVSSAGAQTTAWSDRAFLNVNVTVPVLSKSFDDSLAPVIYAERAVVTATHTAESGQLTIEPAGGVRLWRNLGVGAAAQWPSSVQTATVAALVPHPTLFNQPRFATKDTPFERSDLAVHAYGLVMIPIHPRLDIAVFAGPSFIKVQQDIIAGIEVAEAGAPFTTVDISNVSVTTRKVSTIGLNAGVDVTWFLKPIVGIGATVRYVRGYASTTLSDGTPVDLDVGGLQVGLGARLRFR
jgi:hypothetical protein